MKTIVLKAGARINADDVELVDEPARANVALVAPKEAKQGQLDLQAKKPKPWANAHPTYKPTFNLRPSDELHKKLAYLVEVVPGAKSMQQIALRAVEDRVAELLKQYDKD